MKKQIKNTLNRVASGVTHLPGTEIVYGGYVALLNRFNPTLLSRVGNRRILGAQLNLAVAPQIRSLLEEIHSEASPNERRYLYQFFRTTWSGKNSVIEIGPFLGGTTRSIALGMGENALVSPDAHLLTFDRFSHYYDAERLKDCLSPLLAKGVLCPADFETMGKRLDFMALFTKIHQNYDYYSRIVAQNRPVPDKPEEEAGESHFSLADGTVTDAVFVDGCKSWFGTKFFMREVSKAAHVGTYFIFQDYAHYTCFWVAAFVALFKENFRLVSYVDDTYTFLLIKPLSVEEIEGRYPDSPVGLSEAEFVALFDSLSKEAVERTDYFAAMRHKMHKAAALAYIGNKVQAKAILTRLYRETKSWSHRRVLKQALLSPTYTPDHEILLD